MQRTMKRRLTSFLMLAYRTAAHDPGRHGAEPVWWFRRTPRQMRLIDTMVDCYGSTMCCITWQL